MLILATCKTCSCSLWSNEDLKVRQHWLLPITPRDFPWSWDGSWDHPAPGMLSLRCLLSLRGKYSSTSGGFCSDLNEESITIQQTRVYRPGCEVIWAFGVKESDLRERFARSAAALSWAGGITGIWDVTRGAGGLYTGSVLSPCLNLLHCSDLNGWGGKLKFKNQYFTIRYFNVY